MKNEMEKTYTLKFMVDKISEFHLDKRSAFIKILNKLVHKLQFKSQTFYLASFYLDYILKKNKEIKIENAAIGSLLLASKFDEIGTLNSQLIQFQSLNDKIFLTIEEIRKSEFSCLTTLNYKLNFMTAYHFINYFFFNGIVFVDDKVENFSKNEIFVVNKKIAEKVYIVTKEVLLYFIEGTLIIITR